MPSRVEVEAAVAQFLVINRTNDWRRMPELFTEDGVVMNSALAEPIVGRDAIAAWVETWADWPVEVDIEWVVIDGDRAAVGWRQRYANDQPPDEQPSYRGVLTLVYAADGRFSSYENFFDMKAMEALTP